MQELLFTAILTLKGQREYVLKLQAFQFPPGWAKLQSPLTHLQSWQMQEAARAAAVTPVVLRTWLTSNHVRPKYIEAVCSVFAREMRSKGFDAVDMIVSCFALQAHSNAVILAKSMSSTDRHNLPKIIRTARRGFQKLFEAAAIATSTTIPSNQTSRAGSQSSQYSEIRYLSDRELEEASTITEGLKATDKAKEFRQYQQRPNLHTGLHFSVMAAEYATPNNCNVLIGEDKHKFFKKAVMHTNFRDVEKSLLLKESLQQTICFLRLEAFIDTDPDLTAAVQDIAKLCPKLLMSVSPPSDLQDGAVYVEESEIEIAPDEHHANPRALVCIPSKFARDVLHLPICPSTLPLASSFARLLREAFARDYNSPNIFSFGTIPLQWCQKLSFMDE